MLQKIQMRPGINREGTNYSNEGGWFECDKVRFRSGFPEKIGGWTQATPSNTYQGICRSMVNWVDLTNNYLLGTGTNLKYYINRGLGVYNDVTPLRSTQTGLVNPFTTTTGELVVKVTDTSHGAETGDFVTFSGATGFNNVATDALNSEYQIYNVIDNNNYEIIIPYSSLPNASGAGGGGSVTAKYQIATGYPAYTVGNGWGAGIWNGANTSLYSTTLTYTSGTTPWVLLNAASTTINVTDTTSFPASGTIIINAEIITYSGKTATSFTGCVRGTSGSTAAVHAYRPTAGTPAPVYVYDVTGLLGTTGWGNATAGAGVGVGQQMRIWTNDNYGQNLLMAPRGGQIYYWVNNVATFDRAVLLSSLTAEDVPVKTNQVIVSDVSRFVIAMGSDSYGDATNTFDPMLVRWSDQEDPYVWNPAVDNQAGEQRLSNGSYIMQAKKNRQEILIWTDSAIYSMQYLGPPYVWGFQLLMDNISIMGPNSAIVVNNVAYWMGTDKFYSYSGVVQTLPCSLRQYIFDDISFDQRYQIVAGTNEGYNEVWWYYVSQSEVNAAASENRTPYVDRYVIYNHLERIWYYGSLSRTYWLDTGLQQYPLAANIDTPVNRLTADISSSVTTIPLLDASAFPRYGTVKIGSEFISYLGISGNSLVQCTRGANGSTPAAHYTGDSVRSFNSTRGTVLFHENGVDDGSTATPVPFDAYISSSDFDIGDGHNFGYVWRIIPDVNFTGSTNGYPQVYMQAAPRNFSGSAYTSSDVTDTISAQRYYQNVKQYIVQQYTPQVYTRLRGRQMSFRIGSGGQLGVAWQLGSPRLDIRPDGKR